MSGTAQLPAYSPRTFSQVLDRIYRLLRADFRTQFGIAVLPGIAFLVGYGTLFAALGFTFFPAVMSGKQPQAMPAMLVISTGFVGFLFVYLIVLGMFLAAASYAGVKADCGVPVTIREAYAVARDRAAHFIGLILSVYGVCFLPTLLLEALIFGTAAAMAPSKELSPMLIAIIPIGVLLLFAAMISGVIVALRLSLAFPASVFESLNIRESMKRSWALTRGAAGRIFLVMLVVYAAMYIAMMVVMMVVLFVAGAGYLVLSGVFHPGAHTILTLEIGGAAFYLGLMSVFGACFWTGLATTLSIIYNDQRLRFTPQSREIELAGGQG